MPAVHLHRVRRVDRNVPGAHVSSDVEPRRLDAAPRSGAFAEGRDLQPDFHAGEVGDLRPVVRRVEDAEAIGHGRLTAEDALFVSTRLSGTQQRGERG
jgi:hypothetical protein